MPPGALEQTHWIEFRNDSGSSVPAFAVMRVTGVEVLEPGRVVLTCDQPNTWGCQYLWAINGPIDVADGDTGICSRDNSVVAKYDIADGTPGYGETWGPKSGSWLLHKNVGGFVSLGDPTNETLFIGKFATKPFIRFRGTINTTTITKNGGLGTASIFYRNTAAAYADSGFDTPSNSVVNDLDEDLAANAVIQCVYDPYDDGSGNIVEGWLIIQGSFTCP